jgi:predicted Zn finger-like uncharacterized protein
MMSQIEIKCAECRARLRINEKLLGTSIKCPKCKETFIAEAGDTYALADDSPAQALVQRAPASTQAAGERAPTASKPTPQPKPETRAERKQREDLEKWASRMEDS